MDIQALFSSAFNSALLDDILVWGVAMAAGVIALIALANALESLIDTEVG